ncbi:hypothetical protein BVX97_00495 [bacterium E08(2017)]|nr:hypothetical protein BVX97_00495 [bacterium E08(2017)]
MQTNPVMLIEENRNQDSIDRWIRLPKNGEREYHSGLSRGMLYELIKEGEIRSVSLKKPGHIRGCRLIWLPSLMDYLKKVAARQDVL